MSRVSSKKRKIQLKAKHKKKAKLAKLRQEYLAAKTSDRKEKVLEKARRITPWLSKEEFLAPIK